MDRPHFIKEPATFNVSPWIAVSFLIWLYCFRGFMTGELAFDSDAIAYYQHIKFFIDNLVLGNYPFWDPSINSGVPNEFFLRRMGSFNPFFMIIVGLRKMGLPHLMAYNWYLSVYYLAGAIGFYKLSTLIFQKKYTAYLSFLLLYFSSLGTRQFDSYIILVFVPLVWFFYFLVSFGQRQQKHSLLGLVFCLMNLATTYIPLYFLVILVSFILFVIPIYPKETLQFIKKSFSFLKHNKLLSCLCAAALLVSLIPGIMIFRSAGNSEFVMPRRGVTAGSEHALEVGKQTITEWAVLEELVYTSAFVDLKRFKFAIIYVPGIIYLILMLGAVTRINRKLLFLFSWGMFLLLLSIPGMTPLYGFLHDHIFFFKYFRNLHWFFWLAMLPIFVLFAAGLFDQLISLSPESKIRKMWLISFIVLIHILFAIGICLAGNTITSTYVIIVLSLIFHILHFSSILSGRFHVVCLILTLLVAVQSIEVYGYLNQNAIRKKGPYKGDIVYDPYKYSRNDKVESAGGGQTASLYYSLKIFNDLYSNVNGQELFEYKNNNFIIYDSAEYMDLSSPDYQKIESMFKNKLNHAYIHSDMNLAGLGHKDRDKYQVLTGDSDQFEILNAGVDSIKIKTYFPAKKLLVLNNVYHRHWRAVLNGLPFEIIPTNLAFQGVLLPAGENVLELHFGSAFYRWTNYFIGVLFYGMFVFLLFLWRKEYQNQKAGLINA